MHPPVVVRAPVGVGQPWPWEKVQASYLPGKFLCDVIQCKRSKNRNWRWRVVKIRRIEEEGNWIKKRTKGLTAERGKRRESTNRWHENHERRWEHIVFMWTLMYSLPSLPIPTPHQTTPLLKIMTLTEECQPQLPPSTAAASTPHCALQDLGSSFPWENTNTFTRTSISMDHNLM